MAVLCEICEKVFSSQSNLNRHRREVHSLDKNTYSYDKDVFNFCCLDCSCSFPKNADVIDHLRIVHLREIKEENVVFQSLEEFKSWKHNIEVKENYNYVVARGKKNLSSGDKVQYFNCSRSVTTKSRKESVKDIMSRKRNFKTQGNSKLKYSCISKITLRLRGTAYFVNRIHSNEIQHLRISNLDKKDLASKLVDGVSIGRLLDDTRNNIDSELKRIDLLTRQDLVNIRKSYNIHLKDGVRHKNDAISVDLWVEECRSSDYNPVLFYKRQGENYDHFNKNDFCLIIMNEVQASLFGQFGKNIIAIDSTHGLNNYDFELTTIMVIDEFNEGFPVSFMFTNRKDTQINTLFFNMVKQKVGVISCKTFMSDITGTFYNAWVEVMNVPEHRLYCSWHVDRAWRSNLNKIINKDKRALVYKTLKYLQTNTDISDTFQDEINAAVNNMLSDPDIKSFGEYFLNFYSHNYLTWAYCFRKNCGINTNMVLESMHKVIKYFYLDGKCVKRLDKGLHAILKYVRDKIVDRVIKHTKGKHNVTQQSKFKRHWSAMTSNFSFNKESLRTWEIVHENKQYMIQKTDTQQICCKVHCKFCEICIHQYTCTCPDYCLNTIICKHIHFVVINTTQELQDDKINSLENKEKAFTECTVFLNKSNINTNHNDRQKKILQEISELKTLAFSQDASLVSDSIYQQTISNIRNAKSLLQLPSTSKQENPENFVNTMNLPGNKNIVPQNRFFSTRKKKKTSETKIRNPDKDETEEISKCLKGEKVLVISNDSSIDHSYC